MKKIKKWNELIKFILAVRDLGVSEFSILTTESELIIYPKDDISTCKRIKLKD